MNTALFPALCHEKVLDATNTEAKLSTSDWAIRRGRLSEGVSAGVEVVQLNNGSLTVSVLPTRGMGIWNALVGELPVGWTSPVRQPVHPSFVNLKSRNGLGWLDGFNELVCRCGLAFNGPPGTDDGQSSPIESDLTLHGRIANLPAHSVTVEADAANDVLKVRGVVDETTLFGPQLRMTSTVSTRLGTQQFTVTDTIENFGATSTEVQLLYHTNVGRPFLDAGARLMCPAGRVVPRDPRAAEDIATWDEYLGPTPGYAEQAYFFQLQGDADGNTLALLKNAAGERGFCVRFNTSQLPCFTQWKCTQPEAAGYVTGLEPGINFPNFKSFERRQGRVPKLEPGARMTIELNFDILTSGTQVAAAEAEILALQSAPPVVEPVPVSPFCAVD
ncbi:MAG: aldose 1-epimerase family protein [Planctomycetaceae bacterium]|nr:aldose 1-epimerase family protein [Planctomycetaceae bacterium]